MGNYSPLIHWGQVLLLLLLEPLHQLPRQDMRIIVHLELNPRPSERVLLLALGGSHEASENALVAGFGDCAPLRDRAIFQAPVTDHGLLLRCYSLSRIISWQ
jgi:hypothetical protein